MKTKIHIVEGLTLEQWIEKETKERTAELWGDPTTFSPVICTEVLGDGLQLISFWTLDQRPHHWLIRIDSKTDIRDEDFDEEEIAVLLEEEFGTHPECVVDKEEFEELKGSDTELDDYDDYEHYLSACEYPALWYSGSGGYSTIVNMVTGEVG